MEYVQQWQHLGHVITCDQDDKSDILQRRSSLAGQINNVLCYFGKLDCYVKQNLLISYCFSLYGSVLWDLGHSAIEQVCVQWRKGLRRVWGLPPNTHSTLLHVLAGRLPLFDELVKRSVSFIQRCMSSDCFNKISCCQCNICF